MTSELTKPAAPFIPYTYLLPVDFVYPDPPEPDDPDCWPRDMIQAPTIAEADHLLRHHFDVDNHPEIFIDSGGFVFFSAMNLNRRIRPDLYISFGVDARTVYRRNGYSIPEAGKAPDFALEVASPTTYRADTGDKRVRYREIEVGEYWMFDVTGGQYYGFALAADRLVDGVSLPIPITTEADGTIWGYSPALDLCLCWQNRRLRFYDRKTGRYLNSIGEERAAHQRTAAERDQAAAELDAERAAREASEAEVERLRGQLRSLQGQ
jgi:hypothetical protein